MTAPARIKLVGNREVKRVVSLYQSLGLPVGAVDIRADGVTIYPPSESVGNAYDLWKDQNRDGHPHG